MKQQQDTLFNLEEFRSPEKRSYADWQVDTNNGLGSTKPKLDPKSLGTKTNELDPKKLAITCQNWNPTDIKEAIAILAGLLEAKSPTPEQGMSASNRSSSQKGHFEEKLINGRGPYRYLRYYDWDEAKGRKVKRSVYMGKQS